MYLFKIMKSHYCKIVFIVIFLASYFLIPQTVFNGWYYILAISFMLVFSLTATCLTRNIKEKVVAARSYKGSFLSVISAIIGLSALQVCGIGAPICGASIGMAVLSLIFPRVVIDFLHNSSVWVIVVSLLFQILGLYYMKCFLNISVSSKKRGCVSEK